MNGLARALFFGKRGELRERGIQDQLQRACALNILINVISVWNTVYPTEATKLLKEKENLREESSFLLKKSKNYFFDVFLKYI